VRVLDWVLRRDDDLVYAAGLLGSWRDTWDPWLGAVVGFRSCVVAAFHPRSAQVVGLLTVAVLKLWGGLAVSWGVMSCSAVSAAAVVPGLQLVGVG